MWRWIGGIVGVVVVVLIGTCYAGYRKIAGGGNTVQVTLALPLDHTFALLTTRDSLLTWLPAGTTVMPATRQTLQPGDTIRVAGPSRGGASDRATALWIVREVKAPTLFAIEGI